MENKKETKIDLKKMSRVAGIMAVVLLVVLIVSIVVSSMTGITQMKENHDTENLADLTSRVQEVEDTSVSEEVLKVEIEERSTEGVIYQSVLEIETKVENDGANNCPQNNNSNLGDKTNTQNKNPGTTYDSADTNKDGVVDNEEFMGYITPEKQACIDVGYGVVCEFNGGEKYAVLMKNSDHRIDEKNGREIIDEYLHELGLEADGVTGSWINSEKEWYWYVATDIREWEGEHGTIFQ